MKIIFQNTPGLQEGKETATYNAAAGTLTFQVAVGVSDAKDVIKALTNSPTANAAFSASLDTSNDPTNDGSGTVGSGTFQASGGGSAFLTGTDSNPQETSGIFNALSRLATALTTNNTLEAERRPQSVDPGFAEP